MIISGDILSVKYHICICSWRCKYITNFTYIKQMFFWRKCISHWLFYIYCFSWEPEIFPSFIFWNFLSGSYSLTFLTCFLIIKQKHVVQLLTQSVYISILKFATKKHYFKPYILCLVHQHYILASLVSHNWNYIYLYIHIRTCLYNYLHTENEINICIFIWENINIFLSHRENCESYMVFKLFQTQIFWSGYVCNIGI